MNVDLPLAAGTSVVVQGSDYKSVARSVDRMLRYGTNITAFVGPDDDADQPNGVPAFGRFADAVAATAASACVSFAARHIAAETALEAAQAGIRLIVTPTAGIPIHDTLRVHRHIRDLGTTWINAATSGIARPPSGLLLGNIPETGLQPGNISLITDCGSLGAEASLRMSEAGLGQSLFIDVGRGSVKGTRMAALPEFIATDPDTRSIALLETACGGDDDDFYRGIQILAAKKPVLAYIPGVALARSECASSGRSQSPSAAERKSDALAAAGVTVYTALGALIAALKAPA